MQKGLILINTGEGKGKTTAALGTAIRAWGNGQRVLIFQFIKGAWKYGELNAIKTLSDNNGNIFIYPMGDGFVFHNKEDDTESFAKKKELASAAWAKVIQEVESDQWDLVVLDEANYAVDFGLLDIETLLELIRRKPERLNMIITGRNARPELIDIADTVTEMKMIKHAYKKGIRARKGIEF